MGSLQKLEAKLDELFNKKAPKMPESARKSLAGAWWWIALLFGILQLWTAWELWRLAHYLDPLDRSIQAVNDYLGYAAIDDNNLNVFYYIAIAVLVVDAVILLLASPGLKAFRKAGWNLLFYSALLNVAYGIVRAFSDVGGGVAVLIWSILVSLIILYFTFQVRSYFTMTKLPSDKPEPIHEPKTKHKE